MSARSGRSLSIGRCLVVRLAASALSTSAPAPKVSQRLAEAQTHLLAQAHDDNLGRSVATAGDVNGDGLIEFVVGAISDDSAAEDAGKAYVFLGGVTLATEPSVTLIGQPANDRLGVAVSRAEDEPTSPFLSGGWVYPESETLGNRRAFEGPRACVFSSSPWNSPTEIAEGDR